MMTETFDINAKADESTATIAQLRQMLKTLLADRFKLKFHNESRCLGSAGNGEPPGMVKYKSVAFAGAGTPLPGAEAPGC